MAQRLAALGCRVVPAIGKHPGRLLGDRWQHKATRDQGVIAAWFETWPVANIAILPDRALLPLDVDDPASFLRFQSEHGEAPRTPRYLTGGDGGRERLLFRCPSDAALERADRRLCPGVQLRHSNTTSLVCIVPPGKNPDTGRELRWTITLDDAVLAPFPAAWLERATTPAPARPASHWASIVTRQYVAGCGDTHPDVLSLAAWLVGRLHNGEVALELLLCWNEKHCKPPKPAHEIESIVAWVAKRDEANSGALVLGDAGLRDVRPLE
jgi:hypothetical protein